MTEEEATKRIKNTPSIACIQDLPAENLAALQKALRQGTGVMAVARVIQTEWHLLEHMKENTLVKILIRYRDKVLAAPLAVALQGDQQKIAAMSARVEQGVDVVQTMEHLVLVQLERVTELRDKEKHLKMPFQWAGKEIQLASELCEKLLKMQMDVGLVDYKGHLLNKGGLSVSVTTPDGTNVTVGNQNDQLNAALHESMKVLQEGGYLEAGDDGDQEFDNDIVGEARDVSPTQ